MLDKTRLAKVLAMTTSDNDSEALAAMRKANEIIKGEGLQWDDVLTATVNISLQRPTQGAPVDVGEDADWSPPHLSNADIIGPMFATVLAQPRAGNGDFWQFMESLYSQWLRKQRLTSGQYNALRRCYNRARKRA